MTVDALQIQHDSAARNYSARNLNKIDKQIEIERRRKTIKSPHHKKLVTFCNGVEIK